MTRNTIYGFLKLTRSGVALFGCIGLFVSGIIADDLKWFQIEFLIAFLVVFISASGAFALNDYFDYEVDKINNRIDRPLVTGLLSRKVALYIAIVFLIIVIFLSILLSFVAMILILTSVPLFYLYSMGLKKKWFLKNFLIAFSYMATIILGSLIIDSNLEPITIYFAVMAFIVGLANEIMFDIADVKGDNAKGIHTVSTKFGIKKAVKISVFLYVVIIVLDPLPFILYIDHRLYLDYLFLILILVPVSLYIFFSYSLLKSQSRENILAWKTRVFIIMQFGTISYLIGVLI
ncbi:MAG TPA: hypothetical protein ENI29_04530 [bacterium]|nr:hypothetical protein [bacterium]